MSILVNNIDELKQAFNPPQSFFVLECYFGEALELFPSSTALSRAQKVRSLGVFDQLNDSLESMIKQYDIFKEIQRKSFTIAKIKRNQLDSRHSPDNETILHLSWRMMSKYGPLTSAQIVEKISENFQKEIPQEHVATALKNGVKFSFVTCTKRGSRNFYNAIAEPPFSLRESRRLKRQKNSEKYQKSLMAHIKRHPLISTNELTYLMKGSRHKMRTELFRMKKAGAVQLIIEANKHYWRAAED